MFGVGQPLRIGRQGITRDFLTFCELAFVKPIQVNAFQDQTIGTALRKYNALPIGAKFGVPPA